MYIYSSSSFLLYVQYNRYSSTIPLYILLSIFPLLGVMSVIIHTQCVSLCLLQLEYSSCEPYILWLKQSCDFRPLTLSHDSSDPKIVVGNKDTTLYIVDSCHKLPFISYVHCTSLSDIILLLEPIQHYNHTIIKKQFHTTQ